jgi:hypothetical protein
LPTFNEYQLTIDHVEKLLDRRQFTTSFYLSVNTAISAGIGLLFRNNQNIDIWLSGSILLLLGAGFIACWIWRTLLLQYKILLAWWYSRIRELETSVPDLAQLMTHEYLDLYEADAHRQANKRIGLTKQEVSLTWVFTGLYSIFAIGIFFNFLR